MNKHHETYLPVGWEITTYKSLEEIEAIRPVWEEMQCDESFPVPNTDINRYITVIKTLGDEVQPYIILLRQNNRPVAMTIGRSEKYQLKLKLGYKTLLSPKLRCLTVVYGGILGRPEEEVCSLLIGELMKVLRRREVDMVYFNHLRTDSHFYKLSRKIPGILSRGYFPRIEPHWQSPVPASAEAFWAFVSTSRKRYLRRYIKKLEEESSATVNVVCYRDETDVDSFIEIASQISRSTYKETLCVGFADTALSRRLITQAARKGLWSGYVLYVGDNPCAFEFGIRCGTTYFPEHIAYDSAWKSCSPGTVLFLKALEDLSKDSLIRIFDYGFGPAIYKDRFGAESWPEASVYIFAPRLYPVFINMLRTSVMGLNTGLEYIVNKTGFSGWIKRRWRNLLQEDKKR